MIFTWQMPAALWQRAPTTASPDSRTLVPVSSTVACCAGGAAGVATGTHAPPLPGMSEAEETLADLWSTGIAPEHHPTEHVRDHLRSIGVLSAEELLVATPDQRVLVGGVVTHRQRPATASGTVFLNLEDETGLVNVICSAGVWSRYRRVARTAAAMLVRGTLERAEGVTNVVADKLEELPLGVPGRSRDFR